MAELSTAILSAVSQIFQPQIEKQWNRVCPLLGLLSASGSMGESRGKNVAFDVEFTGATAGTVAEGSDVASGEYNSDINVPAIFTYATYRSSFQISEQEVDIARTSIGSADAIMNIFQDRILGCSAQLARSIETDCLTGTGVDSNGNPTIVGLFGGALSSSGIYGGLNPATYSEWGSNLLANGGTTRTLTPDLMAQMDGLIYTGATIPWTHIVASVGTTRRYESMFTTGAYQGTQQSLLRMNDSASAPVYGMGVPNDAQMQWSDLYYKGKRVVRDPVSPANKLAFINTDLIKIKYLPHIPTKNEIELFDMLQLTGQTGATSGMQPIQATSIPVRLVEIAKTGDAHKISMRVTLAMAVTRRNACGLIQDIQE
jgi:hypothetical protein